MADLLADPVLSGFASAAAFLVGTSQLKHAFGMSELKSEWAVPKAWFYIFTHLKLVTLESLAICELLLRATKSLCSRPITFPCRCHLDPLFDYV